MVDPRLPQHYRPDDWKEVPQALYLSWSDERQLDYCMRRDIHAATTAETQEDKDWLLDRAAWYKATLNNRLKNKK